ncbi:MAG: hypothetical protein KBD05_01290 [Candidatus Pacebacteria bacterium]|nr:hypothetical protein [Candidatus Paceibacterota bacterium]
MFQAWQQLKGIKLNKGEKIGTDKLVQFLKDAETIITADRKNRMDRVRKLEEAAAPVMAAKAEEEAAAAEVEKLLKDKGIDASKYPNWRTAAMPDTALGIGGTSEYLAFNKAQGRRKEAEHTFGEAKKLLNPDGKLDGLVEEDAKMADQIEALSFISNATEAKKDEKVFEEWKATWQTIVDDSLLKGVDTAHFMEMAGEYSPLGFGSLPADAPEKTPNPPAKSGSEEPAERLEIKPDAKPGPEGSAEKSETVPTATPGESPETEADKEKRIAATAKTVTEVLAVNGTKPELEEIKQWLRESKNFEEAEKIMSRAPAIIELVKGASTEEEKDTYKRQLHEEVFLPYTALMVTPEQEAEHARNREALENQISILVGQIKQRSLAYRAVKWNNERNTIDHLMKEGGDIMKMEMQRQQLSQRLRDEYGVEWPLPTPVMQTIMERAGVKISQENLETMPRRTLIKAVEDAQARVDNAAKLAEHKKGAPAAATPVALDPKEVKYREKTENYRKEIGTKKPEGFGGSQGKENFSSFLRSIERRNPSPERASAMFARFVFQEKTDGPLTLREQTLANAFQERIKQHRGNVVKGLKSAAQDIPGIMNKHNKGVGGDPALSFSDVDKERGRRIRNYASPFPTF